MSCIALFVGVVFLKLFKTDFCLDDIYFLQQMGERRDKALKELREQLANKQQTVAAVNNEKQNFLESSAFKIVVSMSMLILVVFTKR